MKDHTNVHTYSQHRTFAGVRNNKKLIVVVAIDKADETTSNFPRKKKPKVNVSISYSFIFNV